MKLLIKIFSQTTCIILLVSSGIFLYTTYCWKNQSIEAGDLSQGSLRIYVKGKTGKCAGQLILTYEDADGKSYEEEIKFDSEIKETQIKSLKVEDDQEKTNNWWYSIAAVVAVLLISIILLLVRKLHKKNILLEEARKAASH